jgi:hypothetical protein
MAISIIKIKDYDLEKLEFKQLSTSNNKIMIPVYNNLKQPSYIQLPKINLDMYGIPSKASYFTNDLQRCFLKLPLNQEDQEVQELTNFLKRIDDMLCSSDFIEKNLCKKAKYNYLPIIKQPTDTEKKRHPSIKLKLHLEYPSNKILTKIVEEEQDGKYNIVNTENLEEFEKFFLLKSSLKCVIMPVKLWIHQTNTNLFSYGMTFKLIKVMIKQPLEQLNKFVDDIDFLDSDSD